MDDESVATLASIIGADGDVARRVLEIAGGDLEQAAALYFDSPGSFTQSAASTSAPTLPPIGTSSAAPSRQPRSNQRRAPIGRQDAGGVIHIDSDDDDDEDMLDDDDDVDEDFSFDDGAAAEAVTVARTAQEEEDAAMAKRLQEELYAENATTSDGIRAPIARTTETLVAPSPFGGGGAIDDDDMEAAVLEQMRRRRQPRQPTHNPFNQDIWGGNDAPSAPPPLVNGEAIQSTRQARLTDLYRPPYDLISQLSWDEARTEGREAKKWILANIQDMSDFNCQVLNRDIWKDEAIKQIVAENFIFLQYTKEDPRGSQYIQYYLPEGRHENPDNYPHVAIIDPRTGEQVKVWLGRPFPDAIDFHAQLAEFLDRYSLSANSKNPVAKSKARQPAKDVGRMTEEEMLEMALQNSLGGAESSSSKPSIHDPDELTASTGNIGKGKGKATDEVIDLTGTAGETAPAEEPFQSAFARIASDRPHEEPANDPATTTRIQFRHSGGRIIRRFAVSDPVVRVYEWLKSEPLEGKDGVEFELKVMPQARDLIEDLNKTIEEAGLKQATVMIEFIEA